MRSRISTAEIIVFFIMLIICAMDVAFCLGDTSKITLKVIELEVFFVYIYTLLFVRRTYGLYDLRTLFMFALGIFSLVNVFLTAFGLGNFLTTQFSISDFVWEEETAVKVLTYYLVFLTVFYFLCLLTKEKTGQIKSADSVRTNYFLLNIAKKSLIITFPLAVVYRSLYAIAVIKAGYASIYNHSVGLHGPLYTVLNGFVYLFLISYYIICMEENNVKQFDKYSILYLICTSIQLAQGSRAQAMCSLVFVLFYRKIVFGTEFKAIKAIIALLVIIPILSGIGLSRQGMDISDTGIINMYDLPTKLSGSINIAGYYIQNRALLDGNTYPYVLDPIIRLCLVIRHPLIMNGGQSEDMIGIRYNLGHQITYSISKRYYLAGHGVDSNFIAEFSEFGIVGVLIGSIAVSFIIIKYSVNIARSKYLKFMSPILVQYILIIPRSSAFIDTYTLFKWTVVFCVVVIFGRMLK